MAAIENFATRTALSPAQPQAPAYRAPPHNIEAEQALLGAILVNNDAYDRVSDFLKPAHFSEELHRRVYEVASQLIRAGKVATPITLKTFLGDHDLGGMTVPQYRRRPRGGGDQRHQRRGLWPHDPRSRGASRADPDRRGHRQRRL